MTLADFTSGEYYKPFHVYRSIVCRAGLTVVSSTQPESHGSMQCVPSKTEPSTWSGTMSSDCRPRTPPGPHQRTTRRHTFSGCSTPKECFVSQIYFVNKNYTQLVFDALMMSGEHNMLVIEIPFLKRHGRRGKNTCFSLPPSLANHLRNHRSCAVFNKQQTTLLCSCPFLKFKWLSGRYSFVFA